MKKLNSFLILLLEKQDKTRYFSVGWTKQANPFRRLTVQKQCYIFQLKYGAVNTSDLALQIKNICMSIKNDKSDL